MPRNLGMREELQKNSLSRSRIYIKSSPQQLSPDRASSRNMEYLRPLSMSKETNQIKESIKDRPTIIDRYKLHSKLQEQLKANEKLQEKIAAREQRFCKLKDRIKESEANLK